jgi:hypothetical protein
MARARALMNNAGFTSAEQNYAWCEAENTATALDSIIVWKEDISTKFYAFFGKEMPIYAISGCLAKMCVMDDISTKKEKGPSWILEVDYACDIMKIMQENVNRLPHIQTGRMIFSRKTQWLNTTWDKFYQEQERY